MASNRYPDPFHANRTRALVVMALVGVGFLLDLVSIAVHSSQASLLSGIATGQSVSAGDAEANDARVQLVAILALFVFLATAVVFLLWIHRAHKNLAALGASQLDYSPGWAVGGFFVPFLNLIRPFQVMREIWKASDPDVDFQNASSWQYSASSPLIGLWWGTWILSGVLGRLVFSFSRDAKTVDALLSMTYLSIASDVANLIPAVLVIVLIRSIEARQQQKHERLTEFWAQLRDQQTQPAGGSY